MLKYIVSVLIYLALSVQIGSVLFFGFGVAPTLFRQEIIPGTRLIPSNTLAGAINSAILSRLGMIEMAACVVLLLGAVYAAFRYEQWMNWVVLVLSAGMLAAVFYSTTVVFPRVDALRTEIGNFDALSSEKSAQKAEFDNGHKLYSTFAKGVLAAAVLTLILHTAGLVRYAESLVEAAHTASEMRAAPEIMPAATHPTPHVVEPDPPVPIPVAVDPPRSAESGPPADAPVVPAPHGAQTRAGDLPPAGAAAETKGGDASAATPPPTAEGPESKELT
jgi:hypothetical protein